MFSLLSKLSQRKGGRVDKRKSFSLVKDRADLTQMMIIIGGFAVAAILAIGTLTGVVLTKGEWAANCINNSSAFMSSSSSSELSREDCSRGEPDENGEACLSTEGEMLPIGVPESAVEACVNMEDFERVNTEGGCVFVYFRDVNGNVVYTHEECLPESEPEPESARTKEECEAIPGRVWKETEDGLYCVDQIL